MRRKDGHYKRGELSGTDNPPKENKMDNSAYAWGAEVSEATANEVRRIITREEERLGKKMTDDEKKQFLKKHGAGILKGQLLKGIDKLFTPKEPKK